MKTLTQGLILASMLLVGSVALAYDATTTEATHATELKAAVTLSFPIAALGNCDSKDACRIYCDQAANRDACFAYAAKVGLMTLEKIKAAKIIISKKGPGSCDSKEACRTYCEDSANTDECLTFAKDNKIIGDNAATLIKKLTSGEGPGACKSAETCRMYCEDSAHLGECRTFAQENGLAPKPKMASSTPPLKARIGTSSMEVKMRLASTTPAKPANVSGDAPRKIGSSTEMQRREAEMKTRVASTSNQGDMKKPVPPKPIEPKPTTSNDGLGAIILKGFAKMLGF